MPMHMSGLFPHTLEPSCPPPFLSTPDPIFSGDALLLAGVGWTDRETGRGDLTYQFFSYDPDNSARSTNQKAIMLNPTPTRAPVMAATAPYLADVGQPQEVAACVPVSRVLRFIRAGQRHILHAIGKGSEATDLEESAGLLNAWSMETGYASRKAGGTCR